MKSKKRIILSVFLTLTVISLLLLSGPASAVTVGSGTFSDTTPNESTDVTFLVKMDIHTNDVIDVQNVTVNVSDGAGDNDVVIFYVNGTELSDSGNDFTITNCNWAATAIATAGYGYGYGYNGSTTYANISASSGYTLTSGYGYATYNASLNLSSTVVSSAELVCNMTWAAPALTSTTNYTVYTQVTVGTSGYYFSDSDPQVLEVQNVAAAASSSSSSSAGKSSSSLVIVEDEEEIDSVDSTESGDESSSADSSSEGTDEDEGSSSSTVVWTVVIVIAALAVIIAAIKLIKPK